MIKLAYGDNKVIVTMKANEFTGLAGKTPAQVADGTDISLVSIKQKLDLVDSKTAELLELKGLCDQVSSKLNEIGI